MTESSFNQSVPLAGREVLGTSLIPEVSFDIDFPDVRPEFWDWWQMHVDAAPDPDDKGKSNR